MGNQEASDKKRKNIIYGAVVLVVLCLVCIASLYFIDRSSQEEPTAETTEQLEKIVSADDEEPAEPSAPTNTTPPPTPSGPTETTVPTNTPAPTNTLPPPPDPHHFDGIGDSVIDLNIFLEGWDGTAIAHIIGNPNAAHFAVTSYDANGEYVDLLVNTVDPYDGYRPVNFIEGENVIRFQIESEGSWAISLYPLAEQYIHLLEFPGVYSGSGDDVIFLKGDTPDLAIISGNAESGNFIVTSYDISNNGSRNLLVNTIEPYEGTVILTPTTIAFEIQAPGAWTIEVTEK